MKISHQSIIDELMKSSDYVLLNNRIHRKNRLYPCYDVFYKHFFLNNYHSTRINDCLSLNSLIRDFKNFTFENNVLVFDNIFAINFGQQ